MDTLFAEGLASLGARVIELGGLANYYRVQSLSLAPS